MRADKDEATKVGIVVEKGVRFLLANGTKVELPLGDGALQAQVIMVLQKDKKELYLNCNFVGKTYNFDVIWWFDLKEGRALKELREGASDRLLNGIEQVGSVGHLFLSSSFPGNVHVQTVAKVCLAHGFTGAVTIW